MALAGALYRLQWGGPLFEKESWSNSLHVWDEAPLLEDAADFAPALTAFLTRGSTGGSNAAKINFIKFNQLDPLTGKYLAQGVTNAHFPAPAIAFVNQHTWPQLATCVTLYTDLVRGRSSHGRIFIPASEMTPDTTNGQMSAVVATGIAASAKELVNDINAVGNGKVVVFSKIGQLVSPVRGVRVGRTLDTQRRRREQIPELYETAPLV